MSKPASAVFAVFAAVSVMLPVGLSGGPAVRVPPRVPSAMTHANHHASLGARIFPRLWETGTVAGTRAGAHVVVVKMITTDDGDGGKFDPEDVVAERGDTVRFVTDGLSPHNVSFPADQNAGLQPPAAVPYITAAGQTYDLVATAAPGTYHMRCDPHAFTGMTGTLTIR
jgi:plastocyanin